MGAPRRGVITLMGMMVPFEGMLQMRLQSNVMQAAISMVTGMSVLWMLVFRTRRAMWGTANPKNDTGPQNAVVVAVSSPVHKSRLFLVRQMLTPRFVAY